MGAIRGPAQPEIIITASKIGIADEQRIITSFRDSRLAGCKGHGDLMLRVASRRGRRFELRTIDAGLGSGAASVCGVDPALMPMPEQQQCGDAGKNVPN